MNEQAERRMEDAGDCIQAQNGEGQDKDCQSLATEEDEKGIGEWYELIFRVKERVYLRGKSKRKMLRL